MKPVPFLLVFGSLAATALHAESTPRESLLVLSKGDHTIAIVDPATLKVVAKAPVGEDPHEVIASSDGKFAYVSNYGGGRYNTITLIDLIAQSRVNAIDLGPLNGPHGLTFVGGKTWFTAEGAKVIGRYDPEKKAVDWVLGTGQNRTHMIWVSPDMLHIYTTNVASGTVTIMEKGARDWDETVVPVGQGAEGFDVTPDGKQLWAANAGDGTISIIDIRARKVIETLPANVRGANRLKFTPNGKLAFVSCLSNAGIAILDAASHKEVKRIDLGHPSAGIEMQPDGSRAFIACTGGNFVAVVDLKSLEVTGKIDAGPGPDGMAWSVRR